MRPASLPLLALASAWAPQVVTALGQKPVVSFNGTSRDFQIAGGPTIDGAGQILVSENDYWGVIRAAGDLAVDFGRVTGTNYTLSSDARLGASNATVFSNITMDGGGRGGAAVYSYNPVNNRNNTFYTTTGTANFTGPAYAPANPSNIVVIAGTIGNSTLIDSLVSSGALDVSAITGQWESFVSQLVVSPAPGVSRALVIAGSDPRGTIFGLYDVSEQIGVSPWYFWADTPIARHENIFVPAGLTKVQPAPSVKYRGVFLNDEQPGLTNWVATNFGTSPLNGAAGYGPDFYAHVLELLLRLRANYLWPAIWGSMYEVDYAANQPLADAYGVVLGSSHTEPLMRAQNEFGQFYEGPWAYNLNNATIDDYFRYGVERAKPYWRNSLFTMGMRGTGDTAIEGLGSAAIVGMLQTLVGNQQAIIAEGLGVNISDVPQMWCLYKEVQSYVFEGLEVPDDVTLLWADDNWGNVRRFPLANETARAGGAGVYYHFDYVGDPRDYKWINTVQLAKTAEQMHMAYARGADRIWIVNVGDLKPLEVPISHFLDMAYDAALFDVDSTQDWAEAWATREFGASAAAETADILVQFGIMANRRKFELIEPESYSVLNYDEGDRVLAEWAALEAQAQAVYDDLLAEEARPAFFQMVLHPIKGGSIVNEIYIGAAKNMLYAGQKRNAANTVMMDVIALAGADANLTEEWDVLLDGKWAHMLDQTHIGYDGYWQQPMRNTLPAMFYVQTSRASLAGHVGVGVEGSNATIQGDDKYHTNGASTLTLPPLEPYGAATRYFDVFTRGTKECSWTATTPANATGFVKLSQTEGVVSPDGSGDVRVYVSVDWSQAPPAPSVTTVGINITNSCRDLDRFGYSWPLVQVSVNNRAPPTSFTEGFVESDGHVAIDAPNYQAIIPGAAGATTIDGSTVNNVTYHTFKGLGRTGDAVGLVPQDTEKLTPEQAPALEYQLYLFSNTSRANVSVWISPSMNYLGDGDPLQYAVSLFPAGAAPSNVTVVSPVGPSVGASLPAGWGYAVADGVWGLRGNYTTSDFAVPAAGAYSLRVWALMPSVVVQKVVVDLGGVRPSYLGPPQSFLVGTDERGVYDGTSVL